MTDPATETAAQTAAGLRSVVVRLAYSLRSAATRDGVTPTRLTAMGILEKHGPMRAGDLAARLNITAASMSRLSEALEQGRWVDRAPDPDDKRACLLSLSSHGRTALESLRRENAEELATHLRDLSESDREALSRALPVLARLTDRILDDQARDRAATPVDS